MSVLTNDLKKGARVTLRNGWKATLVDNKKGNTRLARVEGIYTEIGSIYAHDIIMAHLPEGVAPVMHTPAQVKLRRELRAMGL